ncbi:replication factor A1 [Methanomicrobium sp. W14]|uniref:hypothetical protein n=1 Tax=Methanomicrobium sp. W14 TaxID=2817839 RepID=UPI001AE4954B|nr:hypothetical protein [Methanomicrobium sp. W14]MBP2133913.1 replication factor A1 [Methanomicrobium sp. W14]
MRAYYALVDDILSWDEFEEKVYSLNPDPEDEESENIAAAGVAEELGRLHRKISGLRAGPTLSSFFCKVIEKEPVVRFNRQDKSEGLLEKVLAGDETGEVTLVFWDEKALACGELNAGDVLEIAGRFKSLSNVAVVDLRRSDACVNLREGGLKSLQPCSFNALVLETGKTISYESKDNVISSKTPLFVYCDFGENPGFARINVWNEGIIKDISAGITLRVSDVLPKPSRFREFSTTGTSVFSLISFQKQSLKPHVSKISSVNPCDYASVSGEITGLDSLSGYTRDDGSVLYLRKGVLSDETGSAAFVFWGEKALAPVFEGDKVSVYNALVKTQKGLSCSYPEIHAGYNSCIVPETPFNGVRTSITGTVVEFAGTRYILDGGERYLLKGADDAICGEDIKASGMLYGHIFRADSAEPVCYDIREIKERLSLMNKSLSG